MKFCYACGHATGGEPLFCISCGRSYDVKLCPKLHLNPRIAEACSRCGSRDLSIPQAKVPLHWRLLVLVLQGVSGIVLIFFSLRVLLSLLTALLTGSRQQETVILSLWSTAVLWFLWALLPIPLRRIVYRALARRRARR